MADWKAIKNCNMYHFYGKRECYACQYRKECWENDPKDNGDIRRKEKEGAKERGEGQEHQTTQRAYSTLQ